MKTHFYLIIILLFFVTTVVAVDYFPLAVGNEWTYREKAGQAGIVLTIKIEQQLVVDSGTLYPGTISIKNIDTTQVSFPMAFYTTGNDIYIIDSINQTTPRLKFFEHIPSVDDTWINEESSDSSIVIDFGTLTVPAGTFHSCYAEVQTFYEDTTWFAPDIGMIAGPDYELLSYIVKSTGITPKKVTGKPVQATYRLNRNLYSLIDPLGRCVKRTVSHSDPAPLNVSQGMYFYCNRATTAANTAHAYSIPALHLH